MPMKYSGKRGSHFAKIIGLALCVLLPAAGANADDADVSMFSLRGFGTLGAAHSNQDQADFVGNFFQPNGAGHWRPWVVSVDSKLGVQMDTRFSDKLSGVVQAVARYRYDGSYTPEVEWANVKYQFSPDFDIRIGRFVASTFMHSDVILVGYAYPWIRPPMEVYSLLPFTNKDGVDTSYRFHLGNDVENVVELSYGSTIHKMPGGGRVTADRYLDIHDRVEHGPTTVRLGYTTLDGSWHTPSVNALFDGFAQFGNTVPGPAGQQALLIEHQRRMIDSPYSIITVGVTHDPGDWLLMAEWGKAITHNPVFMSDVTAWYVSGGYRLGAFTPYLTLAQVRPHKLLVDAIPTAGLPPPAVAEATALNGGLAALVDALAFSQDSISAGVRWDFRKNMDLKLQYEHLRTGSGSSGRLINPQAGFRSGDSADVFSLAVDFVF